MTDLKCVVFDIDDSLYMERDYVRSGLLAVSEWIESRRGVSGFFEVAWHAFETCNRGKIFDQALSRLGCNPDRSLIEAMIAVYRTHEPDIKLLPDALGLITRCQAAGLHMACVSDGPLQSQRSKVEKLRLRNWMQPIVLTASLGENCGKPSTAGFLVVSEHLQLQGRNFIYIADNPTKDFVAPRNLGWRTVRIKRQEGLHFSKPSGPDVDAEINSCDELQL